MIVVFRYSEDEPNEKDYLLNEDGPIQFKTIEDAKSFIKENEIDSECFFEVV